MKTTDLSKLKIDESLRSRGPRKRRRFWLLIPFAVALISVYLGVTAALFPPIEVQAVKISPMFVSKVLTVLNASGYVVAQRKAAVSSKATGRIEFLNVEEGKVVKVGDVLASLESKDLKAALDEAVANRKVAAAALENATAELHDAALNFNRQKTLRETGAVSVQAYDTADARYKKALAAETSARFGIDRAEASVKVAEVNLEYSYIRAPFDGVILTKNADVGEVVAPFGGSVNARAAVVTMADMNSLLIEVDVAESGLEKVKVGAAAEVRLDALPNDRFPATVYMIVPTADRAKATVLTKIKLNVMDAGILPEMSAKAAFLSRPLKKDEDVPFLGVPESALISEGGQAAVFLVKEERAERIPIKTGRSWDGTVEVLSGIKEGDLIVADAGKIKNGQRVKVKE